MKNQISDSPEVRARAVRLVFEQQKEHESQWSAIKSIASKIGRTAETLRTWVRRRVSRSLRTDRVLDALEQTPWFRKETAGLIHPSDRGSHYLSIRYTERLIEANIDASVGSVGDSYDHALAETMNGLYKTEVIRHHGPWGSIEAVEFATLERVDWFNNRRLLRPIGNIPPTEFEMAYYRQLRKSADAV